MAVSEKIKSMMEQSSWIRKMFETGTVLKKQHGEENVFDFSLGNPTLKPPAAFLENLAKIAAAEIFGKHGYMPNAGYTETRQKVAEFISAEHEISFPWQNCIMTCGAGGALNIILKTVINPGDKVLVSKPCFMEYKFYADNHQGILEIADCKENFDLDIEDLESRIDQKTAAIIINSPNNPTGKIYPESTIKALAAMLDRKSREIGRAIYLISDEPYKKIVYDNAKVPSVLKVYKNGIIATSFSKDLSIPGERIGWLAINPEADSADALVNGATLCNRILGYVNAPALMQRAVAEVLNETADIGFYKKNRDLLCEGLADLGYEFNKPEGAFYLFPKAPGGDDIAFTDKLQKELTLTVPGSGFACPGYFRIAYCVDPSVIKKSMPCFARALK